MATRLFNQFGVACKLNGVPKALLTMYQQFFATNRRAAQPQWRRKCTTNLLELIGFPTPLVPQKPLLQVALEQVGQTPVPVSVCIVRVSGNGLAATGNCFVQAVQMLE